MNTKIGIISGFLGAGKTTLIRKLLSEALEKEKLVIIENEFGEVGIDGKILKQTGVQVREINSGCICCTLAGDFRAALKEIMRKRRPDRILIEPSGVGKLSGILSDCRKITLREQGQISFCIAVVDVLNYPMYSRNFCDFFFNQIENAGTLLLSRTQDCAPEQLCAVTADLRRHNPGADVVTTPWNRLSGKEILSVAEQGAKNLISGGKCEHDPKEHCHSHAANEAFTVWSAETPRVYDGKALQSCLKELPRYGTVLRAKGILPMRDGTWRQFDYVPEEISQCPIQPDFTGRLCVIGKNLDRTGLALLFQV